ncbi:MAG: NAD-dependent epimerase/dehydratase family protein [Elusimicrobia bacterium]|nr:NAD-dependent epimerase/dehydratase family protein [Elusimicrobiota bacterium]
MEEMKRKILICGCTGFIGRNIAELFACREDIEVFGTYHKSTPLEHPRIKMLKADLTNPIDVDRVCNGKDVIIQAAATTSGSKDTVTKPYYHVTDNAVMNAYIFRTAFESHVSHVIFLSCTTMYQSNDAPIKECDFDANKEMYSSYFGGAWTKVYNEKICEFYARIGSTKYTVLRHSNMYGPYDKYDLERSHVFGATITKVLSVHEGGSIVVWGQGDEERDLLHVRDLVDCIALIIEKQESKFELLNVGCGSSISIKELVNKIIKHSGKKITIEYDLSKPSIKTKICLDITKVKDTFGWSPRILLDDGIRETLTWRKKAIKNDLALQK